MSLLASCVLSSILRGLTKNRYHYVLNGKLRIMNFAELCLKNDSSYPFGVLSYDAVLLRMAGVSTVRLL